jgi:hypothetical protein
LAATGIGTTFRRVGWVDRYASAFLSAKAKAQAAAAMSDAEFMFIARAAYSAPPSEIIRKHDTELQEYKLDGLAQFGQ